MATENRSAILASMPSGVGVYLLIGHFRVDLCGAYPIWPSILLTVSRGTPFERSTVSRWYGGPDGIRTDGHTAEVCDVFQRVFNSLLLYIGSSLSFRCCIPVFFKNMSGNIQKGTS